MPGTEFKISPIEYGASIKVTRDILDSPEHKVLLAGIKQAQICANHRIGYAFSEDHYRKYRRGANRCHHCGVKIKKNEGLGCAVML